MIDLTPKGAALAAIVASLWIGAGCSSPPPPSGVETPAPAIAHIPRFAADDPRIETAGFVGLTLRKHHDAGDRRFTMMAFAVDDTLTLGAMVRGSYRGNVRWVVAGRAMTFRFDTDTETRETPVAVDAGATKQLTGRGATFRGTMWINVEVPKEWLPPGGFLKLEFQEDDGPRVALPKLGASYRATYVKPPVEAPAEPTSRQS